jgi:hypothetical protein
MRWRPRNNQLAQQEGGITRGQEGSARGGNATTSFIIFRRAILAICSIDIYCATMTLHGVVVCRAATVIRSVVFGCAAMVIGGVVFFSLTATGIGGIVFRHGTLVVGIVVFRRATPLQQ